MSIQELQQNFFKEMMSVFQDMVDRQTDKLSDDAEKVNFNNPNCFKNEYAK